MTPICCYFHTLDLLKTSSFEYLLFTTAQLYIYIYIADINLFLLISQTYGQLVELHYTRAHTFIALHYKSLYTEIS